MLKLFTDFNARTLDGLCWNLFYKDAAVDESLLKSGDRVILFQDLNDFEVEATVEYRFIPELHDYGWVANPHWATKRKL